LLHVRKLQFFSWLLFLSFLRVELGKPFWFHFFGISKLPDVVQTWQFATRISVPRFVILARRHWVVVALDVDW
jgi:hypothetical protein